MTTCHPPSPLTIHCSPKHMLQDDLAFQTPEYPVWKRRCTDTKNAGFHLSPPPTPRGKGCTGRRFFITFDEDSLADIMLPHLQLGNLKQDASDPSPHLMLNLKPRFHYPSPNVIILPRPGTTRKLSSLEAALMPPPVCPSKENEKPQPEASKKLNIKGADTNPHRVLFPSQPSHSGTKYAHCA